MFRLNFQLNIDKPKWFDKLFKCPHEPVRVEENFYSRYGCRTSYMMCLKCERKAMELKINCKHNINTFGMCMSCMTRFKDPCEYVPHDWTKEPNTNDEFCLKCGEWKDSEPETDKDCETV